MRGVGQAGILAAILFVPSCGSKPEATAGNSLEPLRRATFRALVARDFLVSCPGGATRSETLPQMRRLDELKHLAARKHAGRAIWLGENDWGGVARYSEREPCEPGEEPYREALAAFKGGLDSLAGHIAAYRE